MQEMGSNPIITKPFYPPNEASRENKIKQKPLTCTLNTKLKATLGSNKDHMIQAMHTKAKIVNCFEDNKGSKAKQ